MIVKLQWLKRHTSFETLKKASTTELHGIQPLLDESACWVSRLNIRWAVAASGLHFVGLGL